MNNKNIFGTLQKTMSGCPDIYLLNYCPFYVQEPNTWTFKAGHPDTNSEGHSNYFFRVENMATQLAPFRGVAKNLWIWIGVGVRVYYSISKLSTPPYPYSESQASYKSTQSE